MMMKNPVHPGKLVEANLEELGLSVAKAAKAMKVTRQQLYNVIRGKSAVSPDMALRFERRSAAAQRCGWGCSRPMISRRRGKHNGKSGSDGLRNIG